MRINMPMEFPGTAEERLANYDSHDFYDWAMDGEYRCGACDCKPWHITAGWPCGFDVPRVEGTEEDVQNWHNNFAAYAVAQAIAFME